MTTTMQEILDSIGIASLDETFVVNGRRIRWGDATEDDLLAAIDANNRKHEKKTKLQMEKRARKMVQQRDAALAKEAS